jgi:hypothetical protein
MSNQPNPISGLPRLRKLWKPVIATGVGGTTLAIWFEEIIAIMAEFIGVIAIALMAGLIYLFNIYIFKSAMPRREDIQDKTNQGVKK